MKVLGIDPGLRKTGWGIINFNNNVMKHIDNDFISPLISNNDGERLLSIFKQLESSHPEVSLRGVHVAIKYPENKELKSDLLPVIAEQEPQSSDPSPTKEIRCSITIKEILKEKLCSQLPWEA